MQTKKSFMLPIILIAVVLLIIGGGIWFINNKKETSLEEKNSSKFLMTVDTSFLFQDSGMAVTGTIKNGSIKIGDEVEIIGMDKDTKETKIIDITRSRKKVESANQGETVTVILDSNIGKEDCTVGQVLASPNSIKAYKTIEATISLKSTQDGGRTNPIFSGFYAACNIRGYNMSGLIILNDNERIDPGTTAKKQIKFKNSIALRVGDEFELKAGGDVIGTAKVTKLLEN